MPLFGSNGMTSKYSSEPRSRTAVCCGVVKDVKKATKTIGNLVKRLFAKVPPSLVKARFTAKLGGLSEVSQVALHKTMWLPPSVAPLNMQKYSILAHIDLM